jgi:O-methyltransferase
MENLNHKASLILEQLKKTKLENQKLKLKEEILKLNHQIEAVEKIKDFHFWYCETIGLLNELNDFKNSLSVLNRVLNIFPFSLNLLYHLYYLLFKLGKIYESIKVLNLMVRILEKNRQFPEESAATNNQLLSLSHLNYLRAAASYELCNYEAFEFYFKQVKDSEKYIEAYQQLKSAVKLRFNNLKTVEDNILQGDISDINYFRLSREHVRELEWEKGLQTYLETLKLAFKNNNLPLQQLIFSDLLLNANNLALDQDFIAEIIEEGKNFADNFSYLIYTLGIYFLSIGNYQEAENYFDRARQTEQKLKADFLGLTEIKEISSVDKIINAAYDPFLTLKIIAASEYARAGKNYPEPLSENWNNIFSDNKYWERKVFEPNDALNYFLKTKNSYYIDLMQKVLTDTLFGDYPEEISDGKIWPEKAYTMIGLKRLDNVRFCIEDVLSKNIPGDFIEAGVWRGGTTMFMRAILKFYGITDRRVFVADSFAGLPPPDELYPIDKNSTFHKYDALAISLEEVQNNFATYNLLDDQVVFLKGWFKDTLKTAPIEKLAILRLDGDLYSSTWETLESLYDKLSVGGNIIIDDYYPLDGCNSAVDDFRKARNIREPILKVDWSACYWQKTVK